ARHLARARARPRRRRDRAPAGSRSSQELGEPPVLEHPAAGQAVGAVVDGVLLEVDAGDGRAADVARLAELLVDPVDARVARAALAELEAARQLGVDRLGEPL